MSNPISIKIPDDMLRAELRRLLIMPAWAPMMAEAAEILHGEIVDNLHEGGRPKEFAPLNDRYAAEKAKAGYTPTPLIRRGGLLNSLTASSGDTTARVSTNLIYAAIHHFGGTIKPKNGKALSFSIGRGAAAKRFTRKSVTIPARPYMLLTKGGEAEITNLIDSRIRVMLGIE